VNPHQRLSNLLDQIADAAVAAAAVPAVWVKFDRDDERTWPPRQWRVCVWYDGNITTGYLVDGGEGKWGVTAHLGSSEGRRDGILWCIPPQPPPELLENYDP
jgi:hypothetical protein